MQRVELGLYPRHDAGRRLERHLLGELVVIAVVPLEAVVARKVALEGGEDRHAHLVGAFAHVAEVRRELRPLLVPSVGQKAVLGEQRERFPLLCAPVRLVAGGPRPLEQRRDFFRDDDLRVREGVQQKHLAAILQRNADVED